MAKKSKSNKSSDSDAKKVGRSSGKLVYSQDLGRMTSPKRLNAISNNKSKE